MTNTIRAWKMFRANRRAQRASEQTAAALERLAAARVARAIAVAALLAPVALAAISATETRWVLRQYESGARWEVARG